MMERHIRYLAREAVSSCKTLSAEKYMISVNQLLNILSEKVCLYRDAYTDVRKKDNVLIKIKYSMFVQYVHFLLAL